MAEKFIEKDAKKDHFNDQIEFQKKSNNSLHIATQQPTQE